MKTYIAEGAFRPHRALPVVTVLALAMVLCLAGCSSSTGLSRSSTPASASASVGEMQVKDVSCYFDADADPQQIGLTFFADLPSVPYMRIDDFYQTFLHGKMNVVAGDDGVSFDLRFAVLTCGSSYSSANLLPQLLHERGVAVLGERSGGGPCALEYCTTADGWRYSISSNTQVKSDNWESIDGGVPVDAELVKVGANGKRDYSGLYDLDAMSSAIASFYSK